MKKTILKTKYFERGLSKLVNLIFWKANLWKVNLIFPLHVTPFYEQWYEKQKRSGATYQSINALQNISRNILFSHLLLRQFWWFNKKWFLSFPKIQKEKSFLDEIKSMLYDFWKAWFWYNIKIDKPRVQIYLT